MNYGADTEELATKPVTDAMLDPYRTEVKKLTEKKRTLQAYTGIALLLSALMFRVGRRA